MKTLDELRKLPREVAGYAVYFLWWDDELMYVGSTKNVNQRLHWHHCAWRYRNPSYWVHVRHNRATSLASTKEECQELEYQYIGTYCPPFNINGNPKRAAQS